MRRTRGEHCPVPRGDLTRRIDHPEGGWITPDDLVPQYAWHGRPHTAHVAGLLEREGW